MVGRKTVCIKDSTYGNLQICTNFEFDDNYITDRDHLPLRVKYKISAIKIMNK